MTKLTRKTSSAILGVGTSALLLSGCWSFAVKPIDESSAVTAQGLGIGLNASQAVVASTNGGNPSFNIVNNNGSIALNKVISGVNGQTTDVSFDQTGNHVYVTGRYNVNGGFPLNSQVTVNGTLHQLNNSNGVFVAKYDLSGNLIWFNDISSPGNISGNDLIKLTIDTRGFNVDGTLFVSAGEISGPVCAEKLGSSPICEQDYDPAKGRNSILAFNPSGQLIDQERTNIIVTDFETLYVPAYDHNLLSVVGRCFDTPKIGSLQVTANVPTGTFGGCMVRTEHSLTGSFSHHWIQAIIPSNINSLFLPTGTSVNSVNDFALVGLIENQVSVSSSNLSSLSNFQRDIAYISLDALGEPKAMTVFGGNQDDGKASVQNLTGRYFVTANIQDSGSQLTLDGQSYSLSDTNSVTLVELDFDNGHQYLGSGKGAFVQDVQVRGSNSPNGRCYIYISGGGKDKIKFGVFERPASNDHKSFIAAYRLKSCMRRIKKESDVADVPRDSHRPQLSKN